MQDYADKIEAILNWAGSNDSFDTLFVESLKRQVDNGRQLSQKQQDAVDTIIEKFQIDIGEWG